MVGALRDYDMVLLMFATEIEILNELQPPDRASLFEEAAKAYQARANVRRELGKRAEAKIDQERALKLLAKVVKIRQGALVQDKSKATKIAAMGRIRLINAWTEPVSVMVDGKTYSLAAGEQKDLSRAEGTFAYEVEVLQHRAQGLVEAGKTYTIRIRAQQ